MSLVKEQIEFTKDVAELIQFAETKGLNLTFGEAYRPMTQQLLYVMGRSVKKVGKTLKIVKAPVRSATMNSMHMKRLAVDFNLFIDGELTWNLVDYQELGEFWETLSPKNRWGGNWKTFKDAPHFERRV